MSEIVEKVEIAEGRARIYHLLARCFLKEVSPDFLKGIRDGEFLKSLKELGVEFDEGFLREDEKEVLEGLASEYAKLFIAPGGIPPYESVWLKGLLLQEPATEALAFYKRSGFTLPEDFKGFPDQVGVELSFMGHLAQAEGRMWKEGKEEEAKAYEELEKEFLKKHLSRWIFKFCEGVERCSLHPFYKEMARLTRGFIESEMEEMGLR